MHGTRMPWAVWEFIEGQTEGKHAVEYESLFTDLEWFVIGKKIGVYGRVRLVKRKYVCQTRLKRIPRWLQSWRTFSVQAATKVHVISPWNPCDDSDYIDDLMAACLNRGIRFDRESLKMHFGELHRRVLTYWRSVSR